MFKFVKLQNLPFFTPTSNGQQNKKKRNPRGWTFTIFYHSLKRNDSKNDIIFHSHDKACVLCVLFVPWSTTDWKHLKGYREKCWEMLRKIVYLWTTLFAVIKVENVEIAFENHVRVEKRENKKLMLELFLQLEFSHFLALIDAVFEKITRKFHVKHNTLKAFIPCNSKRRLESLKSFFLFSNMMWKTSQRLNTSRATN